MITELTTSSVALAIHDLSKQMKKIDIVVGAATSRLTGDACQPYGFHWAYDTHALAVGTGGALVEAGGDTWFFMTADYAFGYALEKDTGDLVKEKGGKVLGSVRIPLNSSDFSSFLLQAQSSKAKIIGLANAGLDTTNSIKQAAEFGIVKGGQKLAGLLLTLAEVHGLGLEAAQGLVLTEGYYWDRDDKSRDLANRFFKRTGRMPNMIQAGTYSATLQYLKAVKAAGTKDTEAVAKKLKELPVDDDFAQGGKVLENGRMVHDLYLFEVKKPSESKKPWDYYKQLAVVPGDKAFPAAKDSRLPAGEVTIVVRGRGNDGARCAHASTPRIATNAHMQWSRGWSSRRSRPPRIAHVEDAADAQTSPSAAMPSPYRSQTATATAGRSAAIRACSSARETPLEIGLPICGSLTPNLPRARDTRWKNRIDRDGERVTMRCDLEVQL